MILPVPYISPAHLVNAKFQHGLAQTTGVSVPTVYHPTDYDLEKATMDPLDTLAIDDVQQPTVEALDSSNLEEAAASFLGVPFFDDDIYKLIVRFAFNCFFVALIVAIAYHPKQKNKPYVFTFLLMNIMIFFICFSLKKLQLQFGMALGMFAVFSIIRYRTDAIKVKEMTYLFVLIGVAVINALSNKKTSYMELLFINSVIFFATLLLEQFFMQTRLLTQNMTFDNLDLLRPDRRAELLADIRQRTGLDAKSVQLKKMDLKSGTGAIVVHYEDSFDENSLNSDAG